MKRIREVAAELVNQYGSNDPFVLCENLDVTVLFVDLPFQIRGFYSRILQQPLIYLNTGLNDERERRVVCAHELGHAVLHSAHNSLFLKQSTGFVAGKYEKEADLFAGYLLLDGATVAECRCNAWSCEQIACFTGLSETVVDRCLAVGQ